MTFNPASPGAPIVIGLGEVLWDCFADDRRPGGAPSNVAFQANQLGCDGRIVSRVGNDSLGDELLVYLTGQGLAIDSIQRDDERPTGTVTVETSRADHPVFTIHENVAWDFLAWEDSLTDLFQSASAVCFGALGQRSPVAKATIAQCLAATRPACLVVFDVNLRQNYFTPDIIETSLRSSKIVKLNEDEVVRLAPVLGIGRTDFPGFTAGVLDRYGVEMVCITRGAKGCILATKAELVEAVGQPVKVVDAVGAGDAFTAALIAASIWQWPIRQSAEFANTVGGMVASRAGAMPHLREEFADLIARYGKT